MHQAFTLLVAALLAASEGKAEIRKPLFLTVDLRVGEAEEVQLSDGSKATVKLLDVEETRDKVRSAIRDRTPRMERKSPRGCTSRSQRNLNPSRKTKDDFASGA